MVTSASYVTSLIKSKSASHVEIWCGESHGAISVFTMRDGVVTSQVSLQM